MQWNSYVPSEGRIDVTRYLLGFLRPSQQRKLLNTSKRLADMKKHLLYWQLTCAPSRKYYDRNEFRLKISALVSDPSL
jgi:hypothetical protein